MTARGGRAFAALLALLLGGALVAGCSGSSGVSRKVGGWFGDSGANDRKEKPRALYARRQGVEVHARAESSSKTVESLHAGEKVLRTRTSGAWAYIEARGATVKGWVLASQLASRPATAATAGKPGGAAPAEEAGADEAGPDDDAGAAEAAEAAEAEEAGDASQEPATADSDAEVDAVEPPVDLAPAAAPVPAPPAAKPPTAKPPAAKKGQVAPSVFDPY